MLLIYSPSGIQDNVFFSRTVKKIFSWKCAPWWFTIWLPPLAILRVKKHMKATQNQYYGAWQCFELECSSSTDLQLTQSKLTFRNLTDKALEPSTWRWEINIFMISHCPCKKVRWWRLVYSLYIFYTCKTSMFDVIIWCFNDIIVYMLHHSMIT